MAIRVVTTDKRIKETRGKAYIGESINCGTLTVYEYIVEEKQKY